MQEVSIISTVQIHHHGGYLKMKMTTAKQLMSMNSIDLLEWMILLTMKTARYSLLNSYSTMLVSCLLVSMFQLWSYIYACFNVSCNLQEAINRCKDAENKMYGNVMETPAPTKQGKYNNKAVAVCTTNIFFYCLILSFLFHMM